MSDVIRFRNYYITLVDDTELTVEHATREVIQNGVLTLYKRNGEYADEEHLGSWPLAGIKTWRSERWP